MQVRKRRIRPLAEGEISGINEVQRYRVQNPLWIPSL